MKIKDLFKLFQGNSFELINMDVDKDSTVHFVARSSENNGVTAKVQPLDGDIPFATAGFANEGIAEHIGNKEMKVYCNAITIDMFGNCFYRGYEFACDDNILVLTPRFSGASRFNMLFPATVINIDQYRYAYGRQYRQKISGNMSFNCHQVKTVNPTGNLWNST